jgi:hypothetical protein
MQDTTILDKIKKLLSLGSSANEHEAARANEKVQELLTLHNLSLSDVDAKDDVGIEEKTLLSTSRVVRWKQTLITSVAAFYDCQSMLSRSTDGVRVSIIGSTGNVAVTALMFEYFLKAIEGVVKEAKKDKWLDITPTFRYGIVLRISKKLDERKAQTQAEGFTSEAGSVSGLVVVAQSKQAKRDVDLWIRKQYPRSGTVRTKAKDNSAMRDGFAAGGSIGVDPQMRSGGGRQLAGRS